MGLRGAGLTDSCRLPAAAAAMCVCWGGESGGSQMHVTLAIGTQCPLHTHVCAFSHRDTHIYTQFQLK